MNFSNVECGRFYFALDMNGDGAVTISDLWILFKNMILIPSKVIAEGIAGMPKIASFFEIDCLTGEGGGGVVFSIFVWVVVYAMIAIAIESNKKA